MIGLFFTVIIVIFHDQIGSIFSSSEAVLNAVDNLSVLLAFTVLLNSVQPVLSGTPWNWFHKPGQRKCVDFWHLIKVLLLVRVGNRTWHILIWDVTTLSGFRLGLLWAGFSNLESRFAQFSSQQMSAYYYVGKLCFFWCSYLWRWTNICVWMIGNMGRYDIWRNRNSNVDIDYHHYKMWLGQWGNHLEYITKYHFHLKF